MARYYNATTGAFWSQDPGGMRTADSGTPGSWNRFGYMMGDPINAADPTGRDLLYVAGGGCNGLDYGTSCVSQCNGDKLLDSLEPNGSVDPNGPNSKA